MSEEPGKTRPLRVTVSAEVEAEVTDVAALRAAATAALNDDEGLSEEERATAIAAVATDVTEAVTWLIDPYTLVDGHVPGVEAVESVHSTALGGEHDQLPDYAALFPLDGEPEDGWRLSPRTVAVLDYTLQTLADDAYNDAEQYGDDPVDDEALIFGRLPRVSWGQDLQWRRQFARAFDDLASDIASGHWPTPRCTAEELALNLAITDAPAAFDLPDVVDPFLNGLPEHPDDFDWAVCGDVLFQDSDVLMLYNPANDGIEDPDSDINRELGAGDLRPSAWFKPFQDAEPRDPHRGFRR